MKISKTGIRERKGISQFFKLNSHKTCQQREEIASNFTTAMLKFSCSLSVTPSRPHTSSKHNQIIIVYIIIGLLNSWRGLFQHVFSSRMTEFKYSALITCLHLLQRTADHALHLLATSSTDSVEVLYSPTEGFPLGTCITGWERH